MPDLADLKGQDTAQRVLEIAAAGGHHLLMVGPPGAGKSMLAARLAGLLPPLKPDRLSLPALTIMSPIRRGFSLLPRAWPLHVNLAHVATKGLCVPMPKSALTSLISKS